MRSSRQDVFHVNEGLKGLKSFVALVSNKRSRQPDKIPVKTEVLHLRSFMQLGLSHFHKLI